jgi:DNA-binding LytR/AlgR family response regulator
MMSRYNCLIVDDEPIASEIISGYCSNMPHLNIVGTCSNALDAKEILQAETVHILFLDIHLPVLDGISFLKVLKNPPQVIFTTAYSEFAVTAFDLNACDYLLKPFPLERFIVAVDKAIERTEAGRNRISSTDEKGRESFLFIKTEGKIFRIAWDELLYAEAQGNYTKIVTEKKVITPNISFSNFEKMLPGTHFSRIHRSFLVNRSKIDHIEGNRVFIGKAEIAIGNNYREGFLKELGV